MVTRFLLHLVFMMRAVEVIGKNITLGSYFITTQDTSFIEQTVITGGLNH